MHLDRITMHKIATNESHNSSLNAIDLTNTEYMWMEHGAWCIGNQKPTWPYSNRIAAALLYQMPRLCPFILFFFLFLLMLCIFVFARCFLSFEMNSKNEEDGPSERCSVLHATVYNNDNRFIITCHRQSTIHYTTSYLSRDVLFRWLSSSPLYIFRESDFDFFSLFDRCGLCK